MTSIQILRNSLAKYGASTIIARNNPTFNPFPWMVYAMDNDLNTPQRDDAMDILDKNWLDV